jgi:hypothetical protein
MPVGGDDFLPELFRGTEGPIYFCALRNNNSKLQSGEVAHIATRNIKEIERFRAKWDRPEHECGIYFHTATHKPGAARRIKRLIEPCTDADRIEKARKALQSITASDNVADAARVMRLVGSHNSKQGNGEWLEAKVVSHNPERRYRLEDLEHWLERAPVIIPRKPEEQKPEGKSKPKHNSEARHFYDDVPDLAVVCEALRHIPNDDREIWRNVGMALNDAYGDAGREVWAEWSASSAKYDAADQEKTWRSFTPGGGIGIGTLFHHAKQNGWQSPRQARRSGGKTKTEKAQTDAADDNELPPEAEDAIALAFADRHAHELRYVNAWGRWIGFESAHWIEDNTLHTFDRVRAVCREIAATGEHSPRVVAAAKTIVAVERLARADRRLAATAEQWDKNSWMLNEKNRK